LTTRKYVPDPPPCLASTTKDSSMCVYGSPNVKAIEKAMLNSIPQKTRKETNWMVKLCSKWARA